MLRLIIIVVLVTGCGNPSASKQEVINQHTLLPDTFKKQEVDTGIIAAAYKKDILSFKDSIDNKTKTLKKINKSIEGSSEGGEAILYLSGKDTLKINITFYGETGKSTYVFYLRNGCPVFYIDTISFYSEPITISKNVKANSTTIGEIILRNNAVVSWLKDGNKVKDKYEEKNREIKDLYSEIQALLKQQ